MQIFTLLLTLSFTLLLAQNYEARKIDMHGGNHNSLGGYQSSSFGSMGMNMILDRNSTKNINVKKEIKK